MWNLYPVNKVLDRKIKQESYRKHKFTLGNIKPQVDNSSPLKYSFLDNKQKPKQILKEQKLFIDYQNMDLIRRMMVTKSRCHSNHSITRFKDSLHNDYFKKVSQEINQQNEKMVTRLKGARSIYSKDKMQKSNEYLKLKMHMSKRRQDPFYDFSKSQICSSPTHRANVRPGTARN